MVPYVHNPYALAEEITDVSGPDLESSSGDDSQPEHIGQMGYIILDSLLNIFAHTDQNTLILMVRVFHFLLTCHRGQELSVESFVDICVDPSLKGATFVKYLQASGVPHRTTTAVVRIRHINSFPAIQLSRKEIEFHRARKDYMSLHNQVTHSHHIPDSSADFLDAIQ